MPFFIVKEATDKIEGRGSMRFHSVWESSRDEVEAWVIKQPSSMDPNKNGLEDHTWSVTEVNVIRSGADLDAIKAKENIITILKKLTRQEVIELGFDTKYPVQFKEAHPC